MKGLRVHESAEQTRGWWCIKAPHLNPNYIGIRTEAEAER